MYRAGQGKFQVVGVGRNIKLVAERAVTSAERLDGAELVMRDDRYGQQ